MKRWEEVILRVPKDRDITGAEVGVYRGQMSTKLLEDLPRLTLLMVDRWEEFEPDHPYKAHRSQVAQASQAHFDEARAQAESVTAFAGKRAAIMHGWSDVIAHSVRNNTLDFVFIDADHTYQGAMADLISWWPKVKPGGWFGGHDWDHPGQGQVDVAVKDWHRIVCPDIEIEMGGNRTWFVHKQ